MAENTVYQPLDPERQEIRVLHLKGSLNFESILIGHLETVSLQADPKPQYESISYCWGEVSGIEVVRLNGVGLEIPASAANVLRQFRPTSGFRTLWVDAVCINQGDIEEKGFQVSIMDQIYTNTERCLIWLGDADAKTKPVFRALKTISDEYYPQAKKARDAFTLAAPDDVKYTTDYFTALFSECSPEDIARLFKRRWFSRVWVYQEAILAPSAIYYSGNLSLHLTDFFRGSKWLLDEWNKIEERYNLPLHHHREFYFISIVFSLFVTLQQKQSPLSDLLFAQNLQAADPRDRFYGLLGLVKIPQETELYNEDVFMQWFQVDYNKSVPEVFADATLSSFIREGNLEALLYVEKVPFETRGAGQSAFPTWVLRFDKLSEYEDRHHIVGKPDPCPLLVDRSMLASCAGCSYVMLRGYRVDSIFGVHANDFLDWERLSAFLHHLDDDAEREIFLEDCLARGRNSLSKDDRRYFLKKISQMCDTGLTRETIIKTDLTADLMIEKRLKILVPRTYDSAKRFMRNRCLFVSARGKVGLGHPDLQEDDCIAALAGGDNLYILRPYNPPDPKDGQGDESTRLAYQFVGFAYLPGVMHGELVRAKQEAGEMPQTFEIW